MIIIDVLGWILLVFVISTIIHSLYLNWVQRKNIDTMPKRGQVVWVILSITLLIFLIFKVHCIYLGLILVIIYFFANTMFAHKLGAKIEKALLLFINPMNINISKKNESELEGLIELYFDQRNFRNLLKIYKELHKRNPKRSRVMFLKGNIYGFMYEYNYGLLSGNKINYGLGNELMTLLLNILNKSIDGYQKGFEVICEENINHNEKINTIKFYTFKLANILMEKNKLFRKLAIDKNGNLTKFGVYLKYEDILVPEVILNILEVYAKQNSEIEQNLKSIEGYNKFVIDFRETGYIFSALWH